MIFWGYRSRLHQQGQGTDQFSNDDLYWSFVIFSWSLQCFWRFLEIWSKIGLFKNTRGTEHTIAQISLIYSPCVSQKPDLWSLFACCRGEYRSEWSLPLLMLKTLICKMICTSCLFIRPWTVPRFSFSEGAQITSKSPNLYGITLA